MMETKSLPKCRFLSQRYLSRSLVGIRVAMWKMAGKAKGSKPGGQKLASRGLSLSTYSTTCRCAPRSPLGYNQKSLPDWKNGGQEAQQQSQRLGHQDPAPI